MMKNLIRMMIFMMALLVTNTAAAHHELLRTESAVFAVIFICGVILGLMKIAKS
jgi:hypothetical protein